MNRSETIGKLATALAKAQLEMPSALKASKNPHFNSKFAGLPEVAEVAKVLSRHGLAYVQPTRNDSPDTVTIETAIIHGESGEWLSGSLTLKPMKADPQGFGSAITYGRRYGLCSLVGIVADEDDDGNAASARPTNGHKVETPQPSEQQEETFKALRAGLSGAKTVAELRAAASAIKAAHEAHGITDAHRAALLAVFGQRSNEVKPVVPA